MSDTDFPLWSADADRLRQQSGRGMQSVLDGAVAFDGDDFQGGGRGVGPQLARAGRVGALLRELERVGI
jgi:hypothetical protein